MKSLLIAACWLVSVAAQAQTTLSNGVPVTGLAGAAASTKRYAIAVPTGASNLKVSIAGGTGSADLYVRFGAAPTASLFDCRPYITGNNESCTFASPSAGTYYVNVVGYFAYSGVTLTASYTTGSGGTPTPTPTPGTGDTPTWSGFSSYYASAIGKTGSALRSALNAASAKGHSRMSYAAVWEALKYTDEDPANTSNVILIYNGRSQAKTYNSGSYSSDPDAWNREHSWPKSHGFAAESQWAHTDIHHLRPADASVNSTRGNKDYDNGGTAISEAAGNFTDTDSFQVRNADKGDVARMMFYMDVRYEGGDSTGVGNLVLVNSTGTSGNNLGKLCTLVAWHRADPVSATELRRHSRIVERQGNRNPFVDNPAWVETLYGAACP